MIERWDARYPDGRLAGFDLIRGEAIPEGYAHLVAEVIVRHSDETHLLMQRDQVKEVYPGWYEIGASGSALKGETAEEAARRELLEETGISASDLRELYRNLEGKTIFVTFLCVTDYPKSAIKFQVGETIDYRWLEPDSFQDFFEGGAVIPPQKRRMLTYYQQWQESRP